MKLSTAVFAAALTAAMVPMYAAAQSTHHHPPATPTTGTESGSTAAFRAANDKMHKDMSITFTGDVDVDFIRGMIPHHAGAIEMAEIALKHSKSREVKKLARGIIKEQQKEIAWMKAWLKKNGHEGH